MARYIHATQRRTPCGKVIGQWCQDNPDLASLYAGKHVVIVEGKKAVHAFGYSFQQLREKLEGNPPPDERAVGVGVLK